MEKPLHVLVAEALGWRDCQLGWVFAERRWCGTSPDRVGGFDGFGRKEIPHYDGDWTATGPLIERWAESVERDGQMWTAYSDLGQHVGRGSTPLAAACNLILVLHSAGKVRVKE